MKWWQWVGCAARLEGWTNTKYAVFVAGAKGKKPFERPKRRRNDNIEAVYKGIGWMGVA
jgi:hypothetical protein